MEIYFPDKFRKFQRRNSSISRKRISYDIKLVHFVIFDVVKFLITEFEKSDMQLKRKITLNDIFHISVNDSRKQFYGNFLDFLEFLNQNLQLTKGNDIDNFKNFRKNFQEQFISFYKTNLALGTKIRKKLDAAMYNAPKETKGILLSFLRSPQGKKTYVEKSGKFRQILELLDFLQKVISYRFEMIS